MDQEFRQQEQEMTEVDLPALTNLEIDTIGEVLNISMGSAATAISTMLDQKVLISTPKVEVRGFSSLDYSDLEPSMLVKIKYIEGLDGSNVMIFRQRDMQVILGLLMGNDDPPRDDFVFDELSISAACEVMNQMMGASATALSEFLSRMVNISTPEAITVVSRDAYQSAIGVTEGEEVVSISFELTISGVMDSNFISVMTIDLAKDIIRQVTGDQERAIDELNVTIPRKPETPPSAPPQAEPEMAYQPPAGPMTPDPGFAQPFEPPAGPMTPDTGFAQPFEPPAGPMPPTPGLAQPYGAPAGPMTPDYAVPPPPAGMAPQMPVYEPPATPAYNAPPQNPYGGMQGMNQTPYYGYGAPQTQAEEASYHMPPVMKQPQQTVNVQNTQFPQFPPQQTKTPTSSANMDLLMRVSLDVSVEIGKTKRKIKEIIDFGQGTVIELNKQAGAPVDIVVNGCLLARGDVVVIDDNFGVRITEIVGAKELMESLKEENGL